ncbi:MAG: sulfite oxidase-like oxidoreductase [Candidatus Promineifilaceae bacterium]
MNSKFVSRGFTGKRRQVGAANRVPPGQYVTPDFPVLSAGPTPRVNLDAWTFAIEGLVSEPVRWSWEEFLQLPARSFVVDIHCVTKWTKLDTKWQGVSIDTLFEAIDLDPRAQYVTAFCEGDYTTNMPLVDIINGRAFVAYRYDDKPLAAEHGGPARLVVPHLYFWKSAKWIRGLRLVERDRRGFWESLGYHNHGDPWKEERYA